MKTLHAIFDIYTCHGLRLRRIVVKVPAEYYGHIDCIEMRKLAISKAGFDKHQFGDNVDVCAKFVEITMV